MGKSLREKCPRASHAAWQAAADRSDPVSLVLKAAGGEPDQVARRSRESERSVSRAAAIEGWLDGYQHEEGLEESCCSRESSKPNNKRESAMNSPLKRVRFIIGAILLLGAAITATAQQGFVVAAQPTDAASHAVADRTVLPIPESASGCV